MIASDQHRVGHAVQEALRKEHEAGKRARVQVDAIVSQLDGEWFYVPVEIAPFEHELGTFYELFSRVEETLEAKGMDVLLVPVRRETPAGEVG